MKLERVSSFNFCVYCERKAGTDIVGLGKSVVIQFSCYPILFSFIYLIQHKVFHRVPQQSADLVFSRFVGNIQTFHFQKLTYQATSFHGGNSTSHTISLLALQSNLLLYSLTCCFAIQLVALKFNWLHFNPTDCVVISLLELQSRCLHCNLAVCIVI